MAFFSRQKINLETQPIEKPLLKGKEQAAELALDVFENEKEIIIVSLIAGIQETDLDISFDKGMLIIKGKRQSPLPDQDEKKYLIKECYWGSFARRIVLPDEIEEQKIQANLKNGLLVLKIPKISETENHAKVKIVNQE
ncbi:MAG: Hsp20/alpha crystallin family protein [Candidatus Paceibacterota bacterium]